MLQEQKNLLRQVDKTENNWDNRRVRSNDTPKLPINLEALKEMEKIALTDRIVGIENLEYVQAQQVLTLNSLIKYLESFGLEANFELKI